MPQPVTTVPDGFTVPPGITEFDFKFVPAAVAGAPVILSNGWVAELLSEPVTKPIAETVPEPGIAFALLGFGLLSPWPWEQTLIISPSSYFRLIISAKRY